MGADRQPQAGARLTESPSHPENDRLSEVDDHGILHGPCHGQLNRILALAAEILDSPSALITLGKRDLLTVALR
jgi:hypothetical protein